jgi:hypothetical protein
MTLERAELLTPIADRKALAAELRHAEERHGRTDHAVERLEDGTDVLVTTIVVPVEVLD